MRVWLIMGVLSLWTFAVGAQPVPGQIVPDPDFPAWFKYEGGGPFFMSGPGDPEGFLYRGTRLADGTRDGDQMALINKMAGTGANCIYFLSVRSHGGDGGPTENPFINTDPAQGVSEVILDQWEEWFTAMEEAGIVIFFFFYDDDQCMNHPLWDASNMSAAEQSYITTIVNRFKHHKLLIWCVKEEYSEWMTQTRAIEIAGHIQNVDDYDHPVAIHQLNGTTFDFNPNPEFTQFAVQHNVNTAQGLHDGTVAAWNNVNGLKNVNMSEFITPGSGTTLLEKVWGIGFGGGYVMVKTMNIDTTPVSDLEICGTLREFMEATRFNRCAPRDDLGAGDTRYVLARPGDTYMAYSEFESNPGGTPEAEYGIDMEAGPYSLKWFDITSETWIDQGTIAASDGVNLFAKPASFGRHAVVYLESLLPAEIPFVRGDCNSDGRINVSDVICVLEHLFNGPEAVCEKSADVNDSGSINLTDAFANLQYIFQQGATPPAPFPGCDLDSATPDPLGCGGFTGCP